MLDTTGLVTKPHRCPIPVSNDPDKIVITTERTSNKVVKKLLYVTEDEVPNNSSESSPLFGGHISWKQREESFKLKSNTVDLSKVGGAEMDPLDIKYVKKCKFVIASGIFDGYDIPHQPSNISLRSKKLFCFLMVVDETKNDDIMISIFLIYTFDSKIISLS
ncbi:unnamed protein product [Trifolium pratense]|uniref:Uncharacterized protein n=1 Tax=Trifolium pratense TaxID=57577 RepID=A0ACB0M1S4_TRIPR|nr:unnamed protein product [Trifolium pratense]